MDLEKVFLKNFTFTLIDKNDQRKWEYYEGKTTWKEFYEFIEEMKEKHNIKDDEMIMEINLKN